MPSDPTAADVSRSPPIDFTGYRQSSVTCILGTYRARSNRTPRFPVDHTVRYRVAMNEPTDTITPSTAADITAAAADDRGAAVELLDDELLVEEISIDGMCGVY